MENNLEKNEVFKTSHLVILVSFTNLSIILTCATFALNWERWVLPLVYIGLVCSWSMHIMQALSEQARLWIYSILLLVTAFFYGVHPQSVYDMVAVIAALILVFTMTGERRLILLSMLTYYLTFGSVLAAQFRAGAVFGRLSTLRVLLHIVLVLLIGWTALINIKKWNQILHNADADIAKLVDETRRMDDFLTNVSHEIRTPVNAVIGLTTVILKKEKDSDIRRDVLTVQRAGHRVAEKISDILDYTELDVGKLTLAHEPYMIASLVNDIVTDLRMRDDLECELVFDVSPEIPSALMGDGVKLKKILSHLISNGVKFTPKGGVYVKVYALPRSYGVNLCVEVTDTGVGMTEDELEHIFNSFYQRDSGRTRTAGGLGLGLPIVHGIVGRMGGFMTIESKPGYGTTVSVSIPQEIVDPEPCMSVSDREQLCLAALIHLEKLEVPRVRDFYNRMTESLIRGLGVPLHWVRSEEELRKLNQAYHLTHVFVGAEEYLGATEYLESLTTEMDVIVIADEAFRTRRGARVKIMRKPFYCFPAATILSLPTQREDMAEDGRRIYMPGLEALVVDDEPMNLLVAEGIFNDYGMRVTTVRSGMESIEACRRKHFDLIFMDHMMPEMDGVEAMKRLRTEAAQRGEELLILALTANAVSSAREMFLAEGFDGFIPKPIEITDLERVLKRVLPKSAITYEPPAGTPEAADALESAGAEPEADAPRYDAAERPNAALEAAGIAVDKGLRYCRNDETFYRSLLLEYARNAPDKRRDMESHYAARDWKNYAIVVHALKSTSKMIGADELSDIARELEAAAKAADADAVAARHDEMLARYAAVTDAILTDAGEESARDGADGANGEDEILEFAPEGESEEPSEDEILEFMPEED